MQIAELRRYPVAGMQGESRNELTMDKNGVQGDRIFTVVDEEQLYQFLAEPQQGFPLRMTQADTPQLALFTAQSERGVLHLSYQNQTGTDQLNTNVPAARAKRELPFLENPAVDIDVNQWSLPPLLREFAIPLRVSRRSTTNRWAVDCGDQVAEFISQRLDKPCRLFRSVQLGKEHGTKDHFTWYTAFHAIFFHSLVALRKETNEPDLTIAPFRPNIVIEASSAQDLTEVDPFAELAWTMIINPSGDIFNVEPCERCAYVNVDQQTGEPSHRRIRNTISNKHEKNFGIYLKPEKTPTTLKVKDELVYIE